MKLDVIFLELMIFLTATIDLTQAHADDMLEKQNCQRLLHPGGIFMGYPAVSAKELITLAITSKSKSNTQYLQHILILRRLLICDLPTFL